MEKMHYYIKADRFFLRSGMESAGYLEVKDGHFGRYTKEVPNAGKDEILDYTGKWVAPGLVDTHIHGFKGHDVMDCDLGGLKEIAQGLLSCGVTSFLPTTLTADIESLNKVSKLIGEHYQELDGARVQGIFFEGPFFTEQYKGAQNPNYFMDPDKKIFDHWQELSGGLIKKIALAPERKGALQFIEALVNQGVHVALAHSAATYQQARAAVGAGASIFVHTFNGMSGFNHRDPGMAGAAMTTEASFTEVICDGHHVHPAAVNVLLKSKSPDKVVLITDCMRAGGMPEGESTLGEFPVLVKDGAARLKEGNSLAGSILELFKGVQNVLDWDLVTVEEAFKMASLIPARSVGIDDQCGSIQPQRAADFLIVEPELSLVATYLGGRKVYSKD